MTTHPWRQLRDEAPDVTVEYDRLPPGLRGYTDGRDRIVLDARLLQVERRCVVLHEQIHRERGHLQRCDDTEERSVREEVARRLVTTDQLLDVLRWARSWHEAADELWVTVDVFRDRLDGLSPGERQMIVALSEEIEHGA